MAGFELVLHLGGIKRISSMHSNTALMSNLLSQAEIQLL